MRERGENKESEGKLGIVWAYLGLNLPIPNSTSGFIVDLPRQHITDRLTNINF